MKPSWQLYLRTLLGALAVYAAVYAVTRLRARTGRGEPSMNGHKPTVERVTVPAADFPADD